MAESGKSGLADAWATFSPVDNVRSLVTIGELELCEAGTK